MAKKKMNFDFKKFLLEKGERVGLGIAGGVAILLITLGVMVGLGKTSPVNQLKDNTKKLEDAVSRAQTTDLPATPAAPEFVREINPDTFGMFEWIIRYNMEDNKRRNPQVLSLVGAPQVDVLRVPVQIMDYKESAKELKWLDTANQPAEIIRPVHMIMVTAAFPYQEQLKQFKRALRVKDQDKLSAEDWPTFAGFIVYRRDTGPDGKVKTIPLAGGKETDWDVVDLDLGARFGFKQLLSLTREPPAMSEASAQVILPGLAMPLLQLAGQATYPEITKLPGLPPIRVLKKAEDKDKSPAARPPKAVAGPAETPADKVVSKEWKEIEPELQGRLSRDNVDIFEPVKGLKAESGDKTDKKDIVGGIPENPPKENCLFRFIDVAVEPGHTYEYLVEIHMVNPNFGKHAKVASRRYADAQFLISGMNAIPKVHVPSDIEFFAVDELALDPKNYPKAAMAGAEVKKANEAAVAVQIHRWVDSVSGQPGLNESGLGDWLVAERLLIHRGENIGRENLVVDAPWWDEAAGKFILTRKVAKPNSKAPRVRRRPESEGTAVNFGTFPPARLVDFQGGKQSVQLGRLMADSSAVEMLVLTPEGKLQVHNGRRDSANGNRKERYVKWRNWINELKGLKNTGGENAGVPQDE